MADIFLSYRRQDSESATGRLADRLEEHFGPERVFRDHDSIRAGEDFADSIRRAIEASTVVLAVVGHDWLNASLQPGRRRLDEPGDFVRIELESALAAGIPIVPVLVEEATMPGADLLPPSLAEFGRCQAVELSETRWRYDADQLIAALQSRFAIESDVSLDTAGGPVDNSTQLFGSPARVALDLLDLATHPTRLIARRQTGRAIDHVRAFAFLMLCLLAGNAALLVGLNVHPSNGDAGLLAWLVSGELFGIVVVALLAVPLTLAWRIVGTHTEYRQITLIFAYVYGGAWLGWCAGAMIVGNGMQLVDANVFDRVIATLEGTSAPAANMALYAMPLTERINFAQATLGASLTGPAAAMFVLTAIVWAGSVAWTVIAWGAFRNAFGAQRWQSVGATALWIAAVVALTWLVYRVGSMF